jgi:hypothetical protein
MPDSRNDFSEWRANVKVTLTLSRANDDADDAYVFGLWLLGFVKGATLTQTTGVWEGSVEFGVQIEIVADNTQDAFTQARAVADAALDSGCNAIQWEWLVNSEYSCREYRKLDRSGSV